MYDYLIVGSGLSGAVFAHQMLSYGKSCLVIEKRAQIGGNVYCDRVEDINIHCYGAHIFHTNNKNVWDYVNQFSGFNNYINSPIANYHGEIYNLPFNMNTFNKMWGVKTPQEAAEKIAKQCSEILDEPLNLEEQAIKMVGRDIYEKLIKGYTEKQWGRSCINLPPFIIKRVPIRYTYDNNYFNHRYQGIPEKGYNTIVQQMLNGAEIKLNTDFLEDKQGWMEKANRVVYTGMLDAFFKYKLGRLQYRSLHFEHKILEERNHQGVAVVNYTDAETPYTRVIEHKHFEFGNQQKTVITFEYPQEWESGKEAYYPVNDRLNQDLSSSYQQLALKQKNVLFLGRLAQFCYYDMDQAIAASLEAAKIELEKERSNG